MSSKENQEGLEDVQKPIEESEGQAANNEMTLDKVADSLNQNQKSVLVGVLVIIALVSSYVFLQYTYFGPREVESKEVIFKAQQYFEDYSIGDKNAQGQSYYDLALEGDDSNDVTGFLEVIEDFSSTKAANLSHFYAGIIYLQKGNYDEAIVHLSSFSSDDLLISTRALSALGDAYAEKGNHEKAVEFYTEASKNNPNPYLTPINLLKLGKALEITSKLAGAKECYEKIKNEYPNSPEGLEIDKYIARVNAKI